MNTTFPTSTYVLHAAPIAQPELRQRVGTWLGSLAFPATFELAADRDGIRVRASVAAFEGAADGFAALTRHALLWVPTGAPPAPDRVWMLQAQSDLPTVQLGGADPFLAWAGRLRAAARALDGEVALRLTILGEDPALQSRLRALSAYSYGASGGVDEDTPNPWALRLGLYRGMAGVGGAVTALSAGAVAAGWLALPVGLLSAAAGGTLFLAGAVGVRRWLRLRNIPREVLEQCSSGPLLRVAFALTVRSSTAADRGELVTRALFAAGLPLSGPVRWEEIEPTMLHEAAPAFAVPLPSGQLAALLAPAEAGDPSALFHPDVRLDVPAPPPSRALRQARFVVGRSVAGDVPVGIDPDGHGLVVGGSRSGKSSLASGLLARLLEDPDPPGLVLVDPHLSLADAFLTAVDRLPPAKREAAIRRLLIITPDQPEVVPLNLLAVPDFSWAGNALVQIGHRLWEDYWGPRMQAALLALFRLAHAWNRAPDRAHPLSLFHLVFAAFNTDWRKQAMTYLSPEERLGALALDALLGQLGRRYGAWQQGWVTEVISPVLSKVMALELSPWLFAAMHQSDFVDLEQAVRERAWIVLRVPAGVLGSEGARLLAAVLYNVWEAVFRRVARADAPIPYFVVVDEAQEIATGMRLETLLAEGAKFGARLFVLTQSLTMLRQIEGFEPVVQGLLANTSTQAFFSPDPEDARLIREVLSAELRYGDMTLDLASLTCLLRARLAGRWQPPTLVRTAPLPPAEAARVEAVIRESIAAHPASYRTPELGLFAAVEALKAMLPPDVVHLLDEVVAAPASAPPGEPARSPTPTAEAAHRAARLEL